MTTRRNFLASIVAAVAMAPQLLHFKAELPIVHFDGMKGPEIPSRAKSALAFVRSRDFAPARKVELGCDK